MSPAEHKGLLICDSRYDQHGIFKSAVTKLALGNGQSLMNT
jgi:hypothetical protein